MSVWPQKLVLLVTLDLDGRHLTFFCKRSATKGQRQTCIDGYCHLRQCLAITLHHTSFVLRWTPGRGGKLEGMQHMYLRTIYVHAATCVHNTIMHPLWLTSQCGALQPLQQQVALPSTIRAAMCSSKQTLPQARLLPQPNQQILVSSLRDTGKRVLLGPVKCSINASTGLGRHE